MKKTVTAILTALCLFLVIPGTAQEKKEKDNLIQLAILLDAEPLVNAL